MKTCECGREIAGNATRCPFCGKAFTSSVTWFVLAVVIGLVMLIAIGIANSSH